MSKKKRVIVKYFLKYIFCVLPVEIAGVILLPIILPFIPKGQEHLPRLFRWFDNHEYYQPEFHSDVDGLLGPGSERIKIGYYNKTGEMGGVYTVQENPKFNKFHLWFHRLRWIGFRNPAYYYKFFVMGFKCTEVPQQFDVEADIPFIDKPIFWYVGDKEGYRKGWYFTTFEVDGKEYHEFYCVIPYIFWPGRGLRARIGYKVRNPSRMTKGKQYQFETSFSPFKKIEEGF